MGDGKRVVVGELPSDEATTTFGRLVARTERLRKDPKAPCRQGNEACCNVVEARRRHDGEEDALLIVIILMIVIPFVVLMGLQ